MTSILPGLVNTVGKKISIYIQSYLICNILKSPPQPTLPPTTRLFCSKYQKFHYISKSKRNITAVPFKMILTYFMVFQGPTPTHTRPQELSVTWRKCCQPSSLLLFHLWHKLLYQCFILISKTPLQQQHDTSLVGNNAIKCLCYEILRQFFITVQYECVYV